MNVNVVPFSSGHYVLWMTLSTPECSLLQPVISDELLEGDEKHRVVKFDRTPIMSTYLLAFIIGEYDYVEARDADGVLVRVYTPVGKKEQGEFALNVSLLFSGQHVHVDHSPVRAPGLKE